MLLDLSQSAVAPILLFIVALVAIALLVARHPLEWVVILNGAMALLVALTLINIISILAVGHPAKAAFLVVIVAISLMAREASKRGWKGPDDMNPQWAWTRNWKLSVGLIFLFGIVSSVKDFLTPP